MENTSILFTSSDLGIGYTLQDCCNSLTHLNNWQERYRQLFKLASKIIPLSDDLKLDKYLVKGCENSVWLHHYFDNVEQKHYFLADSNSKIIQGLLVIILSAVNGQTAKVILSIQLEPLLLSLQLGKYLTPSRANGLVSVMNKIQEFVKESSRAK